MEYIITAFTQASVNKLSRIKAILQRWRAPISCAVYITNETDLESFVDIVEQETQSDHEGLWTRFVSLHVVVEPVDDRSENKKEYPIHMLRSLALKHVQTDYVLLLDVDFVPSEGANDRITRIMRSQEQKEQTERRISNNSDGDVSKHFKTLYIMPAFEQFPVKGTKIVSDVTTVPKTKKELINAFEQKRVDIFHNGWKPGHGATNFSHWFSLAESKDEEAIHQPYWVPYSCNKFEPYVVARKDHLPLFFPEYRGSGFNKASLIVECVLLGFKFRVFPDDFVVHMNHPYGRRRRTSLKSHDQLFHQHVKNVHGLELYYRLVAACSKKFLDEDGRRLTESNQVG